MRSLQILILTLAWPADVAAQPAVPRNRPEIFGSLAWGQVFRIEDRSFGSRPNIGLGVRLPLTDRVGVELEINRMLGLRPAAAPCGLQPGCVGTAREGLLGATLASANVFLRFPQRARVELFVSGGVGLLWTDGVNSLTVVRDAVGVMSELREHDAGLTINAGAGVDVALTPKLALRPQIRIYGSGPMSRSNMNVFRSALDLGYRW